MKMSVNELKSLDKFWKAALFEYFGGDGRPKLRPPAFTVWACLLVQAIPIVQLVSVSYRQLMRITGIKSKTTIHHSLQELMAKGYLAQLSVEGSSAPTPVYCLLDPKEKRPMPGVGLLELIRTASSNLPELRPPRLAEEDGPSPQTLEELADLVQGLREELGKKEELEDD